MIKNILIITVLTIFLVVFSYFILFNKNPKTNSSDVTNNPTATIYSQKGDEPKVTSALSAGNGDYQFNYLIVRPTDIIELYSNLSEKLTSSEAKTKYGCQNLVSGGFYDTNDKHLGLFISDGKVLNKLIESKLFNGVFQIGENKMPSITTSNQVNTSSTRLGLQTGPLLYMNGKPVEINSNTDMARRIVAAISSRGEITFFSLHTKNNPISGPTLEELPQIIKKINATTSLNIVDAINLDGGAHSAFISDSMSLTELSTIGSFFCIKYN